MGPVCFPETSVTSYQLNAAQLTRGVKASTAPQQQPETSRHARTSCLNWVAPSQFLYVRTELYRIVIVFDVAPIQSAWRFRTVPIPYFSRRPLLSPHWFLPVESKLSICQAVSDGVVFQTSTAPVYPSRSVGLLVQ